MNYDHLNSVYENYLEHYGVKGMKWDPSKKKGIKEDRFISGRGVTDTQISEASRSAQSREKATKWLANANRPREVVDTPYGRTTRSEYQTKARISYETRKAVQTERSKRAQERVNAAMRNLRTHQVKRISGKALDAGTKALAGFMGKSVKKKKP